MSENTKTPTLEELKQTMASLDDKFKQLKGNGDSMSPEMSNQIWDICYSMVSNLRQYVYAVEDSFYEHKKNHIPPIIGAERMNNALEVLGLAGDYKAEPRTIFANSKYKISAGKYGVTAELDLEKSKS